MTIETTAGEHANGDELQRFLHALYGQARAGLLVEVRVRLEAGMAQRFVPVDQLDAVHDLVLERGAQTDVYVGVLPRWRAQGARRDVGGGAWVLWADCDGEQAAQALALFPSPASVVVRSGTAANRHAYWLLDRPATVAQVQQANRRLALALDADVGSAEAARILRPPRSLNHKHAPPAPVVLEACAPERRYALHELIGGLLDPPPESPGRARRGRRTASADALRALDPALYVQRLTGQVVGRSRKVHCPLHDDRVPSLHVYPDPERGWYCFGCRRGGSVYDLASAMWRRSTRGAEFAGLRRDLQRLLS